MTREEFDAAAHGLPGATSHALVAAKLTCKARAEIGLA